MVIQRIIYGEFLIFLIQALLNKRVDDLDESELKMLQILRKENEVRGYFENFVSKEAVKSRTVLEVYLYM